MEEEKVFVIGDIHGCLGMLKKLMDKIDWRPDQDRLIFLGDYVDRGEDPLGVVDFILEISKLSDKVDCLLGNHEDMLLNFIEGGDIVTVLQNGGSRTLAGYQIDYMGRGVEGIPETHLSFYRSLKLWIELEDYYLVHAGLRPGVEIDKQTRQDLIWIREPFIYSDHDFGKRVIFGHTPLRKPMVTQSKIGLDTGAVYGNRLTCLELPSLEFHSVEA